MIDQNRPEIKLGAVQTINKVSVGFQSFPAACTPGTGWRHQYRYW